jgi:hypothetical protein
MDSKRHKAYWRILGGGALGLAAAMGSLHVSASAQTDTQYYQARYQAVVTATREMVSALADATLDSACLNTANFNRAIATLDAESREAAIRMRESGVRTLNETRAWNTCRSQREQAARLGTAMSTAQTWSVQRRRARQEAMLADTEEVEEGILIDRTTKAPINSVPALAHPMDANLLTEGSFGASRTFDAQLTVSEDGLVTACNVVASSGSDRTDRAICRRAQLLLRYRPAFVEGRTAESTSDLQIRFD